MRYIGVTVEQPKRECDNLNCPFHGTLPVRGRILEGVVVSDDMRDSIVIRRDYLHYIPKYLRYERRQNRITAHNPSCIKAEKGDRVKIMECRRLSKTKSFVVIEKIER